LEIVKEGWQRVWQRKWLLALGVVVAGTIGGIDRGLVGLWYTVAWAQRFLAERFGIGVVPGGPGSAVPGGEQANGVPSLEGVVGGEELARLLAAGVISLVAVLCVAGLFAVGVAIVARTAQGMIIAGAGPDDRPLAEALRTGWMRTRRLIVIISIPPIPITLGGILTLLIVMIATMVAGATGDPPVVVAYLKSAAWLPPLLAMINGPLLLATIGLGLVRGLADRACVLEDRRAVESFRRGWTVLRAHTRPFAVLLAGQVIAALLVGWGLHLPRLLSPALIVLQPLNWIVGGLLVAWFSAMWTVAWEAWAVD
jgi:hypothetical protein